MRNNYYEKQEQRIITNGSTLMEIGGPHILIFVVVICLLIGYITTLSRIAVILSCNTTFTHRPHTINIEVSLKKSLKVVVTSIDFIGAK